MHVSSVSSAKGNFMDRRTSLYLYAWRNHIDVDYFPMQTAEAFSVPIGGTCAIALDPRKIRSAADEAVKLSHELGHCVYGGFYNKYTPFDVRAQHENKANAWAVFRLIPWGKLKQAVKSGITEVWDLAEYFDVTEDFMRWALSYYTERKNYKFE